MQLEILFVICILMAVERGKVFPWNQNTRKWKRRGQAFTQAWTIKYVCLCNLYTHSKKSVTFSCSLGYPVEMGLLEYTCVIASFTVPLLMSTI